MVLIVYEDSCFVKSQEESYLFQNVFKRTKKHYKSRRTTDGAVLNMHEITDNGEKMNFAARYY